MRLQTLLSLDRVQPSQSWLAAAGPVSEAIDRLTLAMVWAGGLVALAVTVLALYAVLSGPRAVRPTLWIVGGGLVLPALLLAVLFAYCLWVGNAVGDASGGTALQIRVTGRQWWWEVHYLVPGKEPIELANEVHLPLGLPVEFQLEAADVIHSFWVPALAGKADMIPGRTNRLHLTATTAGVYRAQCAAFCGRQHALMALQVVAEPESAFRTWLESQGRPAVAPAEDFIRLGQEAFVHAGCGGCHSIRGTEAQGQIGPDLTHVGSRRTLAAATLDNHIGTMTGWIADAQRIKPGNLMPSVDTLPARELRAVAAYLVSLK
jgi:cytochrome c oxidase subunit 2